LDVHRELLELDAPASSDLELGEVGGDFDAGTGGASAR
jgi:hypothetical protein